MHHGRAGVQDIKNSMIAGGIVGVLSELPVLFRSMVITRSDMMAMEQVCLWFALANFAYFSVLIHPI
jgi:hypothetical protein